MRIARIHFENKKSWFMLFNAGALPRVIHIEKCDSTEFMSGRPSIRFGLYPPGDALVKMKKQKYALSRRPFSWFFRVLIRDRLLFQFEARKERTGQKRIAGVGLKPAKNLGWGVSVNPFNELLCVNFSSIVAGKKVRRVLRESDEPSGKELLECIADCLVKCVKSGFVIKDPNIDNIFVEGNGELVWIDVETKRVFSRNHAFQLLENIFAGYCAPEKSFHQESRMLYRLVLGKLGLDLKF